VPLDTALACARQIADALEAAHEKGIVHRDLKPANVKVTPEGRVKVLDFGLAAVVQGPAATSVSDLTASPTLTMRATQVGMVMGTAAYMAPEQARGKTVDKRADIWAFGVVLYEMLTGAKLFDGEDLTEILASVVKVEPNFEQAPAQVRRLLRRCLEKDPKKRLRDIGDAWDLLDLELAATTAVAPARNWIWPAAAVVLALVAGLSLWGWLRPRPPEPRGVVRFTADLPVFAKSIGTVALSRDGTRLAFAAEPNRQIWVRALDQLEAKPLPGTEGAASLSFSPDGQWISYVDGFTQPNKLKKIAVAGGPAQVLADAAATLGPPTQDWGGDEDILYSSNGALMRIPAAGGTPQTVAAPDPKKNEVFYAGAQLLPGGKWILVELVISGSAEHSGEVIAINAQTGERKILLDNTAIGHYFASSPGSSTGHIVYYAPRTASLMAVAFDAGRLVVQGSPVPVLDGVLGYAATPFPIAAISASGVLAYRPGAPIQIASRTLVWVDRNGAEQVLPAPARPYEFVRLSPDGERASITSFDHGSTVWIYDLARATMSNVISGRRDYHCVWTADGKHLIYADGESLFWAPADGSSPPSKLASVEKGAIHPGSVSSDGKALAGMHSDGGLWVLPLPEASPGEGRIQPFLDSRAGAAKRAPAFSSDGHWVAYCSDETGKREIYVAQYPGPGARILISPDGGDDPRWSRDGRELFYRNGDQMMAVDIQTGTVFRAGKPKLLYRGNYAAYDVAPDGKRFLMVKMPPTAQTPPAQLTIVLNWFEELRRRVPPGK
jgi:serine/threonine-protein kinase